MTNRGLYGILTTSPQIGSTLVYSVLVMCLCIDYEDYGTVYSVLVMCHEDYEDYEMWEECG